MWCNSFLVKVPNMLPKDTLHPTIKSKGSECIILTVLGTHLNKTLRKNKKKVLLKP